MNKRILFITPGLTKGGAETQLMKVASYLKEQHQEVMILALKQLNDFGTNNINVRFLKSWRRSPFSNLITIYKVFRFFKPDIVVAFMFAAIIAARLLKPFFKFMLVSSIRTPVLAKKWYASFKATSSFDDIVVYNSQSSKEIFENNNLIKKNGIVINNAITLPLDFGVEKVQTVQKEQLFVWCCVAHFRPAKDYPTLFKAAALLKDKDFRIDILGHIGNQQWPYQLIEELDIEDKVRILGFQNSVSEYLGNSDAFVLSTNWEGSPNSVLEAMAYSKPVIASAVPGIEEIFHQSKCGFLFERGNEIDLAKKMTRIMEMTAQERDALGTNGRNYVASFYAEEAVMRKWYSLLYEEQNAAYSLNK